MGVLTNRGVHQQASPESRRLAEINAFFSYRHTIQTLDSLPLLLFQCHPWQCHLIYDDLMKFVVPQATEGSRSVGGDESVGVITSSTMTSWITQAATQCRCSLASACLHPSNYLSNMLAHEIVDSLKSLYDTTTHAHQQYPGLTLSFWDEAENICLLLHFVPKCLLHAAVIINLDCWITQLVQMAESNSSVPCLNMILGLLCNSLLYAMVAVCGSSSCRGETAGCDGWMRVCLSVCLSVWLTPGWPVPLPSPSETHPGTEDVGPGLSAARVPAGVRLWTSH